LVVVDGWGEFGESSKFRVQSSGTGNLK
jgi:hypothetical protein